MLVPVRLLGTSLWETLLEQAVDQIVRRAQAGDREAFGELIERFEGAAGGPRELKQKASLLGARL